MYPVTIMVFCKAPEAGKVKTRLAETVGNEMAADIHRHLTLHCLNTLTKNSQANIELWCAPTIDHEFFHYCQSQYELTLKAQQGDDLGQRMLNAFQVVLTYSKSAIVIGTDCPAISESYTADAVREMHSTEKTLIGPAEDGGYVLLGLHDANPDYFKAITWGGNQVLTETLARLPANTCQLPVLWDIDDIDDLKRLARQRQDFGFCAEFDCLLETAVGVTSC